MNSAWLRKVWVLGFEDWIQAYRNKGRERRFLED
jgi:hypothetical protein